MSFGRPFYTSSVVASASGSENLINIGNLVASSPVVDLTSSHQHPGGPAPMLVEQPPIYKRSWANVSRSSAGTASS